jgi:hypothetical protein
MKEDTYKNNTHTLVVNDLVERFKRAFEDSSNLNVELLDGIYAQDIHFKDPIHDIHGIAELKVYLNRMCGNLESCRFEYLDEVVQNGKAYVKWDMHFSHPSLKKGVHKVRGISQIHYNSRIYYQEDVYDMGSMIYEKVPVLGSVVLWLKTRLAK